MSRASWEIGNTNLRSGKKVHITSAFWSDLFYGSERQNWKRTQLEDDMMVQTRDGALGFQERLLKTTHHISWRGFFPFANCSGLWSAWALGRFTPL